ncbi:hypothetical protein CEXT_371281 [Caerostris extrusa]|uniref:Uncharacterized protein n=1 Tax=Caerostris extrusa TaxID=172846 RepID=A0AAV4TST6_CAEEX|nr:hypothetical protein CEXT_371281 [Caerostris extrusa]
MSPEWRLQYTTGSQCSINGRPLMHSVDKTSNFRIDLTFEKPLRNPPRPKLKSPETFQFNIRNYISRRVGSGIKSNSIRQEGRISSSAESSQSARAIRIMSPEWRLQLYYRQPMLY